jgi:hypothetical protein
MMDDKTRLELLYSAVPCNDEQKTKRERLINELERKLGIIKPDEDAMVMLKLLVANQTEPHEKVLL